MQKMYGQFNIGICYCPLLPVLHAMQCNSNEMWLWTSAVSTTKHYPYHSCWATDERDFLNTLGLAVPASASANRSQISPCVLPALADQSRYVDQNGLASRLPGHMKHSEWIDKMIWSGITIKLKQHLIIIHIYHCLWNDIWCVKWDVKPCKIAIICAS